MIKLRVFKDKAKNIPILSSFLKYLYYAIRKEGHFSDSSQYWEDRYVHGGDSGDGSYGRLAEFKAEFINEFVEKEGVQKVIELGCGDGSQLSLMKYDCYLGVDVSSSILEHCKKLFAKDDAKAFIHVDQLKEKHEKYDLALSLDVIYHLTEDDVYEDYMHQLFSVSKKWVVIYSSNKIELTSYDHVKHRVFTEWVKIKRPDWKLEVVIDQRYPFDPKHGDTTSFADFYVFKLFR